MEISGFHRINALVALGRRQETGSWYAPPFHSRLPHPLGGLGPMLDEAAARVAAGAGKLVSSETLSEVLGIKGKLAEVKAGALIPLARRPEAPLPLGADWKRELEEGALPLGAGTASALLAACVQERTGLNPSSFLRRQGLIEEQVRPAFHRDGTEFSAGTALTPGAAAKLAGILPHFPSWEGWGEIFPEPGGARWGMWYLSRQRQLVAGYFENPALLLSGIPQNPPETFTGSTACPAPGTFYPAGRPLLRELAGGQGLCGYPEAGMRIASLTLRASPPSMIFDSEDGEAALRFEPGRYTLSRTPDGVYALRGGWSGGREDARFEGRMQNMEMPFGSRWTIVREGGGWRLTARPEDGGKATEVRFSAHPFF